MTLRAMKLPLLLALSLGSLACSVDRASAPGTSTAAPGATTTAPAPPTTTASGVPSAPKAADDAGAPGADGGDAFDAGAPQIGDLGLIGYGSTGGPGDGVNILDSPNPRPGDAAFEARTRGVSIGGPIPRAIVLRIVEQQHGWFHRCYQQARSTSPSVRGIVHVRFAIGGDGAVTTAAIDTSFTDVRDPALLACVLKGFAKLAFPNPHGSVVLVGLPLSFEPPLVAPPARAPSARP